MLIVLILTLSLGRVWRREQREPDGTSAQVERELQGKMGNIKANAEGVPADAESAEGGGRCRQRQREGGSEEDRTKAGGEEETAWWELGRRPMWVFILTTGRLGLATWEQLQSLRCFWPFVVFENRI